MKNKVVGEIIGMVFKNFLGVRRKEIWKNRNLEKDNNT